MLLTTRFVVSDSKNIIMDINMEGIRSTVKNVWKSPNSILHPVLNTLDCYRRCLFSILRVHSCIAYICNFWNRQGFPPVRWTLLGGGRLKLKNAMWQTWNWCPFYSCTAKIPAPLWTKKLALFSIYRDWLPCKTRGNLLILEHVIN